jgi:hypothetical protein
MTSSNTAPQTCPSECAATNHPGAEHGYEPQENSFAKNHAQDALEAALEDQGIDPYDEDGGIDLIDLADAVVEALLAAGVRIPEGITNPHGV